jgi:hypothetical protein
LWREWWAVYAVVELVVRTYRANEARDWGELTTSQRTVVSFCKFYSQEEVRLAGIKTIPVQGLNGTKGSGSVNERGKGAFYLHI